MKVPSPGGGQFWRNKRNNTYVEAEPVHFSVAAKTALYPTPENPPLSQLICIQVRVCAIGIERSLQDMLQ